MGGKKKREKEKEKEGRITLQKPFTNFGIKKGG